ncbi:MAG: DUF393 domain-containing protein [Planctomycetes bacterium]|nr:DUF393 domain-containing protein [Planctomycetota bacterium]
MKASRLQAKPISAYQFAAFRIILGLYLLLHLARPISSDSERITDSLTAASSFRSAMLVLAAAFTAGWYRRSSALLLGCGTLCLLSRSDFASNPGMPAVALLLILCAAVPAGDPLRLSRRPPDPDWYFPAWTFRAAWILMAGGYAFSGLNKLLVVAGWMAQGLHIRLAIAGLLRDRLSGLPEGCLMPASGIFLALEIFFLPLSLHRRTRPWIWLALLVIHLGLTLSAAIPDFRGGMLLLHAFTFDPEWLPARQQAKAGPLVLFDGVCGLCDRTVQFLLKEDTGQVLTFAPLQGVTAASVLERHPEVGQELASMITVDHHGTDREVIHTHSDAIFCALSDVGGFWRVVSWLRWIPRPLRDTVYRWIAAHRYQWFGRTDSCRLPDPGVQQRFLP